MQNTVRNLTLKSEPLTPPLASPPTVPAASQKGVTNRLFKSFGANAVSILATTIIQVVSVPVLLHSLGAQAYGEWLLLSAVPSYFSLSDLGFSSAAGNEMTMCVSRGDYQKAIKIFQSTSLLVSLVGLILVAIATGCVFLLPVNVFLKINALHPMDVKWILAVLIFQVFFAIQTSLLCTIYRCDGNYPLGPLRNTIQRVAMFVILVLCLTLGFGLRIACIASLGSEIIGNIIISMDVRRRSPWMRLGWKEADWTTIKRLSGPALSYMGFPIGYALNLQGMSFLVGLGLNPVALVAFSTSRTLSRYSFQIPNLISNSVYAELSRALGKKDLSVARSLYYRSCQVSLWMSLIVSFLLLMVGKFIFAKWTHGGVNFDPVLFTLLVISTIPAAIWQIGHVVSMAENRHQTLAAVFIGVNALSLGISWVFLHSFGVLAFGIAMVIGDTIMCLYTIWTSLRTLESDWLSFLKVIIRPPVDLGAKFYGKIRTKVVSR